MVGWDWVLVGVLEGLYISSMGLLSGVWVCEQRTGICEVGTGHLYIFQWGASDSDGATGGRPLWGEPGRSLQADKT